jgi:hypothetical protein
LAPLDDSQTGALIDELSVRTLVAALPTRSRSAPPVTPSSRRSCAIWLTARAGGERGAYVCQSEDTEVNVPATLHAAIAARIDRLRQRGQEHVECCGGGSVAVQRGPVRH